MDNLNVLTAGSEYTDTIKLLLFNGFDFGKKLERAKKIASLNSEIMRRVEKKIFTEDKLYHSCENVYGIVCYTDDYRKRVELYLKYFGVDPTPRYHYLYENKITLNEYECIIDYTDEVTDMPVSEHLTFKCNGDTMSVSQILKKFKADRRGSYDETGIIDIRNIHHFHTTLYNYDNRLIPDKEEIK